MPRGLVRNRRRCFDESGVRERLLDETVAKAMADKTWWRLMGGSAPNTRWCLEHAAGGRGRVDDPREPLAAGPRARCSRTAVGLSLPTATASAAPRRAPGRGSRARTAGRTCAASSSGAKTTTRGPCAQALELIGQLYAVEHACPADAAGTSEESRTELLATRATARRERSARRSWRRFTPGHSTSSGRCPRASRRGHRLHVRALAGTDALPRRSPAGAGQQRSERALCGMVAGESTPFALRSATAVAPMLTAVARLAYRPVGLPRPTTEARSLFRPGRFSPPLR
jgi:hypothetical protein